MPALYPGVQPLASIVGNYTLSADQQELTQADAVTPLVFPSHDMGPGMTLARILASMTATGTWYVRSFTTRLHSSLAFADIAPFQPLLSERRAFFNSALGTAPQAQGFTGPQGSPVLTYPGGRFKLNASSTHGYWYIETLFTPGKSVYGVRFRFKPDVTHVFQQGFWITCPALGPNRINVAIWGNYFGEGPKITFNQTLMPSFPIVLGQEYDVIVQFYCEAGSVVNTRVFAAQVASEGQTDLQHLTDRGSPIPVVYGGGNWIYFGDTEGSASVNIVEWSNIEFYELSSVDIAGYEATASGDTVFVRGQRWTQAKFVPTSTGILSAMSLASNLTPPGTPDIPDYGRIGVDGLGVIADAVIGAAAYLHELRDATTAALVDHAYSLAPAHVFRSIPDGTYRVRQYACTDDGVESVSYGQTDAVTFPETGGYVPPGQPLTVPTAYHAPAIGAGPVWSVDLSNIVIPAGVAGSLPLTGLVLMYQEQAQGFAPTVLTTLAGFTAPEVAAASVAYPGSFPAVIAAYEDLITAIRDLFPDALVGPGYSDGTVITPGPMINPTAQAEYECVVYGKVDLFWTLPPYAGSTMKGRQSEFDAAGDREYLTTLPPAAISAEDGTWTMVCRRGSTVRFGFPSNDQIFRVIPDQSTSSFETLDPPPDPEEEA